MKRLKTERIHAKLVALLLCLAMVFMLTACGNNKAGTGTSSSGKEEITIGWVMPFTGALAEWTNTVRYVEERALKIINDDNGGIYIKEYDKKVPIKIIWADSQSDSTKASDVAKKLVLDDKVDFLIGGVTPDTINPVSAVAETNNMPALMVSAPDSPWLEGGPYNWTYSMLFSSQTMMDSYTTAMTRIETNKKVGIVFDNSVDGVTLSSIMVEDLEKKGFDVVDPGRFPVGTTDYSGIISAFREAGCEIVTVNLVDPDFATMWKQFNQQGYIPKVLNTGKAVHYTAGVETLGQDAAGNYLGDGIITDTFWEPYYPFINTLNGQTAAEMNKDFEDATPGYFADTTLGEDWATFEVLNYLFTTAGTLDKETLRDTLAATDIPTSIGQVKFADNHVFQFPLVTCQWHRTDDGKWIRNIVANDDFPDIPLSDTPIFALPGYTG